METWKALFLPFNCSHVCSTVEPPVSNHPKCKELVVAQSRQQVFNSRQIMNSRQLWNLYQRNKFIRTEASKDILKFRVLEMAFPGFIFPPWMPGCCFVRIHIRLGTCNAIKISQAFHNIARFERVTHLNLFKYVFNVIQNSRKFGCF